MSQPQPERPELAKAVVRVFAGGGRRRPKRVGSGVLHLDLFSGIGGFAYAADRVWPGMEHVFCDNDAFCRLVLARHWPESEIYEDIRDITSWERERPFLLTGGFPCQPFSAAGLRRGTSDDRYLWPEMLRVIRLTEPEWVIAENVCGLLTLERGVVFEQVCLDLEASDYEVQPFVIPAVAVNAPHRRDRVWVVAHYAGDRRLGGSVAAAPEEGYAPRPLEARELARGLERPQRPAADAGGPRLERRSQQRTGQYRQPDRVQKFERASWDKDWTQVAAELCRLDDGLPVRLDGFKLSSAGHRKAQLKAYGNAIVPQVAIGIMRGMAEAAAEAELEQAA